MDFQAMDLISDHHPLLEPRTPGFSNLTIRRAYIVWLRCGQRNEFRDVCNYYHRLEQLESSLPEYTRAISRHHEFSLFITDPPTSPYQMSLFPNLYSAPHQPSYNLPIYNKIYFQPQPYYQPRRPVAIDAVAPAKMERKPSEVSLEEIFAASQVFKTPEEPVYNGIAAELDIRAVKFPEDLNNNNNKHTIDEPNKHAINESTDHTDESTDHTDESIIVNKSNKNKTDKSNKTVINKSDEQKADEPNKDKTETVPEKDILKTIQLVHNYCKELQIPVKNFWRNFNEYAERCQLSNSVYNVTFYVNNKMAEYELPMALFELKIKSYEKAKKLQPTVENRIHVAAPVNETQDSPSTSYEPDEEVNDAEDSSLTSYESDDEGNETQDLLSTFYESGDEVNETRGSSLIFYELDDDEEIEREKIRKLNEFNEDLASFVNKITREQEETIKKFFEEASLRFPKTDDNDDDDDVSKCRKI